MLAQGNAVHAALERGMGLSPPDRTADNLERALRAVWPAHRGKNFADRAEESAYGTEALEMLRAYADREDLAAARVLAREKWVAARLPTGIEVFGKVDRFDARADDPPTLEVIDYKVSRGPDDPGEVYLPDETSAADVYPVAGEAETGWRVDRVRFIYLKSGNEIRLDLEPEDIEAATSRLNALTDDILTASDFAANPGGHCGFCPWELGCDEAHRVKLEQLVPVEDLPF